MSSLKTLVDFAHAKLSNANEARLLVEHVSKMRLSQGLITEFDDARVADMEEELVALLARRQTGEPLQYVIGSWDFRQLRLAVDGRVLIPRPETEEVCGAALRLIGDKRCCVVDLGTGSGAIALSIVKEAPNATVHAVDNSVGALDVARMNAGRAGVDQSRLHFHEGDWFDPLPTSLAGKIDAIVSNPPYLADGEVDEVDAQVTDWEPMSALFGGPEGLDHIDAIVHEAIDWLAPGGALVVEFAPTQADKIVQLCRESGFCEVGVGKDMTGRDRWIEAIAP